VTRALVGVVAGSMIVGLSAIRAQSPVAFKLGTFERDGRTFVGVVLRDSLVVDVARANEAVPVSARVESPRDMKDLIARYDSGLRTRINEIVRRVDQAGPTRPPYVIDLASVRTLPPIVYPTTMLNVAVNYREHAQEMAGRQPEPAPSSAGGRTPPGSALPGTTSAPGIWERKPGDERWNPYMFIKLPSAVIASGEAIRIPPGRTQIDWECELGVVIGRPSTRVPIARASEHIFGYTVENDVSDRGGRGDTRQGSDWLIAKSHDTFAPLGPFIVPREFVPDPQKLAIRFTLNGQVMQDANTALMIHDVFEQVSYASHITTLRPGDVIATGSPAGVGSARTPPIFLKHGDVAVCTYDGVGTLRNTVVGAEAR
jgi:2-keto-4-pentenoate hydratase/2-oxohepta-3-ene-1,7-dioic acid hydratase in catechol pathway